MQDNSNQIKTPLTQEHSALTLTELQNVSIVRGLKLIHQAFPEEYYEAIRALYSKRFSSPELHFNNFLSLVVEIATLAINGEDDQILNLSQRFALYWNASNLLYVLQKYTRDLKDPSLSTTQISWRARMLQHDIDHIAGIKNINITTYMLDQKFPDTSLLRKLQDSSPDDPDLVYIEAKLAYLRSIFRVIIREKHSIGLFAGYERYDLLEATQKAIDSVQFQLKSNGVEAEIIYQNGHAGPPPAFIVWNRLDAEMIVRELVRNMIIRAGADKAYVIPRMTSTHLELTFLSKEGNPFPPSLLKQYPAYLSAIADADTEALEVLKIPPSSDNSRVGTGLPGIAVLLNYIGGKLTISNDCSPFSSRATISIPIEKFEMETEES